MIIKIVKSLLMTLVISTLTALLFSLFGFELLNVFIITLVVIFIAGFLLGQISETLAVLNNKKLENERIKEFSKQGVSVDCAYCGEVNFTPIRFDSKNTFACNECNKQNSIYLDIITTQITNPLQSPAIQMQTINPDESSAISQLQNG